MRNALKTAAGAAVTNAGLELDRYVPEPGTKNNTGLTRLYGRVCGAAPPEAYRLAFGRWRETLAGFGDEVATAELWVRNRLIVGLGDESVRESAITLHRTTGMPFIPGSALKGLARRHAARLAIAAPETTVLFGGTAEAAYITWFDAWYIPGSAADDGSAEDDHPLARDVITVHHPEYYRTKGGKQPWDFDDPNPVPYVSATGRYLIAVRGWDASWANAALTLLTGALAEHGVGAKTSSGYGRLQASKPAAPGHPILTTAATGQPHAGQTVPGDTVPAAADLHPLALELHGYLKTKNVRDRIQSFVDRWDRIRADPAERRRAAIDLVRVIDSAPELSAWARDPKKYRLRPLFNAAAEPEGTG